MAETQEKQPKNVSRRRLMQWLLGMSAAGTAGAMLSSAGTIQSMQRQSKSEEPVTAGDRLVFALGPNKGQAIRHDSILIHEAIYVFPENKDSNHDNLIFLVRLDPKTLQPPTIIEWTAEGFVAYSANCTHLGCTVNFSHEAMEGVPYPHLHCPCHGGIFDPHRSALVVAGPPPRPLPQLPIKINEQGELIAAGWFKEPPGPIPESELQQWRQKNKS
ncbi:Rieske 2Fe-2S domain-containing protein [Candidatus Acetothermia bacterium]|nr:Rieske 2Fe-2S domain-containing protein [Candidatus Acetothermia bacterium]